MQFQQILALAFAAAAATASPLVKRSLCSSALDTPLCCQVDVDGLLDLTCSSPPSNATDVDSFKTSCASEGLTAECCTLPVLGEALLCVDP